MTDSCFPQRPWPRSAFAETALGNSRTSKGGRDEDNGRGRGTGVSDKTLSRRTISKIANKLEIRAQICAQNEVTHSCFPPRPWPRSAFAETAVRNNGRTDRGSGEDNGRGRGTITFDILPLPSPSFLPTWMHSATAVCLHRYPPPFTPLSIPSLHPPPQSPRSARPPTAGAGCELRARREVRIPSQAQGADSEPGARCGFRATAPTHT